MGIIGELVVLMAGNNAQLTATIARSEAEMKAFSGTASTHAGLAGSALHAVGIAALGMGAAAVVGGAVAVKAAGDFQEQMGIINTIAHQTPAELDKTGDAIRRVAVETGEPLSSLTSAFYDLLSAGIAPAKAMDVLHQSTTLAIGSLSTTAQAVNLITGAINGYHLTTKGAATATDQFALAVQDGKVTAAQIADTFANVAPLAHQMGVGIDEISASYAVLTAKNVPAAEVTTQMTRAMVELLKPNADLNALQEKTHLNFAKIAGEKGLVVALEEMREAAQRNHVPFTDLFGRLEGLNFALATTGPNFKGYADELTKMHHTSGTAAEQAAERMQTFDRQSGILGQTIQNLFITIGGPLLPAITSLVQGISGGVQAVTDWVASFPSLLDALASVPPAVEALLPAPIRDGIDAFAGALGTVARAASDVAGAIAGFVSASSGDILAGIATAADIAQRALGSLVDVVGGVASAIGSFLGDSGTQAAILTAIAGAADTARTAIANLAAAAAGVAGAIAGFLGDSGTQATILTGIGTAADIARAALATLGGIAASALGGLQTAIAWLADHQDVIPVIAGAIAGPLVLAFAAWAVSAGAAAAATLVAIAPLLLIGAAVGALAAAWITDFGGIRTAVTNAVTTIAPMIQNVLGGALGVVQTVVATVSGWIGTFVSNLTAATGSAHGAGTAIGGAGSVLSTLAGIVGTVVTAIASFVGWVIDGANRFGVFKSIGDTVNGMFGILGGALGFTIQYFTSLANVVSGALSTAFNAIKTVIDAVTAAVNMAVASIKALIDGAKQAVDAVANIPGVKLGSDAVGGAGNAIGGALGALGGLIPHFDMGGVVPGAGPQLAVVHGGETVVPPGAGLPTFAGTGGFGGGSGGSSDIHLHHTTQVVLDGRTIMEWLEEQLFRNANGSSSGFAGSPVLVD